MFIGASALCLALAFTSCGESTSQQTNVAAEVQPMEEMTLIGKTLELDYGTMKAVATYTSETELTWTSQVRDVELVNTQQYTYVRLSPTQFFLNWLEADGTNVSQVIDLEQMILTAYHTISAPEDATAIGGRVGQPLKATIKVLP